MVMSQFAVYSYLHGMGLPPSSGKPFISSFAYQLREPVHLMRVSPQAQIIAPESRSMNFSLSNSQTRPDLQVFSLILRAIPIRAV
jgi:hypothetical protein